jgi:uncharacterized metal-binding protein YceD (DUF177 family)
VGKFSLYSIPLRGLSDGAHEYNYSLDNQFFKLISDSEADLQKGAVEVQLTVKRKTGIFELLFKLTGEVQVPCDRCLDDMPIEVNTSNRLIVKFGKEYSEESDEIVIIPEEEGEINIAWFLYEFVSLTIPMKHVHPAGKCNRLMSSKLNKHRVVADDDDDAEPEDEVPDADSIADADPRWDSLRSLNFDENE